MRGRWIVAILLAMVGLLPAQNKGSIRGVVTDKETGEPLIGVNILVKGTRYGATTDADGFYIVPEIEPGEYTLEATYIGYKVVQHTGIRVKAGQSVTVNFQLTPSPLALGQEIEVIGERPLLDIDETSTVRSLRSDDIRNRIVNDVTDLVSQQVGVVQQDNEIHIRGARTYENQYLLDGISVQDPLSGTGFGLNISANAVEEVEVITGGFKAEYGQATSGIISVRTKSGGDHYEGYAEYKSDHMGIFKGKSFSFNTDQYEFSLGGPEPILGKLLPSLGLKLPGKFYFFTDIYAFISDDYTRATASHLVSSISPRLSLFGHQIFNERTFAPRQNNNWSLIFKLTWKIDPTHKLAYSYNRSLAINQNTRSLQTTLEFVEPRPGFPYEWSKTLDNFNTYTHDNEQISLIWTHTLNKSTFYELRASRYFAQLRSDWQGKMWWEYIQPVDVPRLPVQYFIPRNDSSKVRVIPGDGFFDYGNANFWHDHYVEWYTLKGDITSRYKNIHTFKAGFESSFKEMQLIDIADPAVEGGFGSSQDIYRVHPAEGAFYVQDDIRFEGAIINLGVRLDYWAPGDLVDNLVKDPKSFLSPQIRQTYLDQTFNVFGRRVKARLMPRLGVSHPVSNNMMLYFNYGHFSKWPKPQFVYAKLGPVSAKSAFQRIGNPTLEPETSVKYELGLRRQFTTNDVLTVTAFYKDIFDYIQTASIPNFIVVGEDQVTRSPRLGNALTYVNLDYARVRGIEVEYKTRIGHYFNGSMSGSYSIATTKASSSDIGLLVAQGRLDEQPIKETFARWDRPWQFQMNLAYNVPANAHPRLLGLRLFGGWSLSARLFAQAGRRYTPAHFSRIRPEDGRPIYLVDNDPANQFTKVAKSWKWVDVNFRKHFQVGGLQSTFSVEIRNLFNNKNPQIINPVTGDAYHYGDPVPSDWNDPLFPDVFFPISQPFPLNPARYLAPRNIRFGISWRF
ncbi:MAG: TonB-dependent receptor [Calditrichaeota bacterium]|nr:MAG: TonB-dependent receptor [Calditrichota bacterium]